MEIEKLKSELKGCQKRIENDTIKNNAIALEYEKERISELETEINKHLDIIEETIADEDGEETTIYYLKKDGITINLNELIDDKINEIHRIYNNDLVFISVDEYSGYEVTGIFSFKKRKIIFPFIIQEFDTENENGLIYLFLEESLADEMGGGLVCYLYKDGSFFQNEGVIVEKINSSLYILEEPNSSSQMLYDSSSGDDDHIILRDIQSYHHNEERNLLTLETSDSDAIYDIKQGEFLFLNQGLRNIKIESDNFFSHSFGKFTQIINRNGKTLFSYSSSSEMYTEKVERPEGKSQYIEKEREYFELNLQNEFYRFEENGINFNNDFITLQYVTDLRRQVNVCFNIGILGNVKIFDINFIKLNNLVKNYFHSNQSNMDDLKAEIKRAQQKEINFKLFNFFDELNINYLPFKDNAVDAINKIREEKEKYYRKKFDERRLNMLTEDIINQIGNKFNDDSYFKMNKAGDIEHMLIENGNWFKN